jgi:predicted transcriptional regulator
MTKNVLLSIRPHYAEKIFNGTKTVELRRLFPLHGICNVFIYSASPIKAITGIFVIDQIVEKRPNALWQLVRDYAGVTSSDFDTYFSGTNRGYGLFVKNVRQFNDCIKLEKLRQRWPGFQPPQGYIYLNDDDVNWVLSETSVQRNTKTTKTYQRMLI